VGHNPSPTRGPLVGGDPEGGAPCGPNNYIYIYESGNVGETVRNDI